MASLETLRDELRRSIDGEVRFDAGSRALYAADASNYRRVPVGVVIPRHEGDVIRTVALARENHIPILPRGGGTALAGQTTTTGIVIDFSKYMNRVTRLDPDQRVATVQPGLVQAHLNAAVSQYDLFFAPDPTTKDRCTLGGMIGNNSCGAHSAAYGKTVDNVTGLDLLLYDGTRLDLGTTADSVSPTSKRVATLHSRLQALASRYGDAVRERFPKIPRRVSGYNLDQLMPEAGFNLARAVVGAEGTLGVVLNATVQLAPKPATTALVVLGFEDVFAAGDQMPWLLEYDPQALEGFDHYLPDFARDKGNPGVKLLPAGRAFLLMELGGDTLDQLRDIAETVKRQAESHRECEGVAVLLATTDQRLVWSVRESGLGSGALIPGHPRTWPGAEDCAVPPQRVGEFLRRFVPMLARYDLAAATYYGHFGEGCIHCRVNFDFFTALGVAKFRAAMVDLGDLVSEFGGSLSGEHGDGIARSELLPKMFGSELMQAFREFKEIFDPDHRMNPGVMVEPEPLDSNLRIRALPPVAVPSHFDFSSEGGLAGAALKCVGIGKCRKTDAGTMCPSYMATREEMHSTRGRARLLYEGLAGNLLPQGFADEAIHEALSLCLSCKACKTECPAAIDMPAYKAEFMARYYETHRRPPQVQFFGRIHALARAASWAPRTANLATSGRLGGWSRTRLDLHPQRQLPTFAAQTFRSWFGKRTPLKAGAKEVLLFPDTFTNFFAPEVPIAATQVLERAGFRVSLPRRDICCGRPMFEAGMLDAARASLLNLTETLRPYAENGFPIVGLEPSCLLTLRDELLALFPGNSAARRLSEHAMLFDEFIARNVPEFVPKLSGRAIVHGHCHSKALVGMSNELAILSRSDGLEVEAPDTGCCGMAGAFGYGIDRFEISRTIGERVLLPAIRNSPPDSVIIADGFACRAQIRQFCPDRTPLHLAQALNTVADNRAAS